MSKKKYVRKPCSACGGPKPPGRPTQTCGQCGPTTIVPRSDQDEMIRLYVQEGKSLDAVGAALFWQRSTVKHVLQLRGIPLRARGGTKPVSPRDLTNDTLDRTVELYLSGLSVAGVAKALGMSETGVRYRLAKAGVIRSKSDGFKVAYRATISRAGRAALTERQARALDLIEAKPRTTPEVTAALGVGERQIRAALESLEVLGLVKSRRPRGSGVGKGRASTWTRTDLPLQGVLDYALERRDLRGNVPDEDKLPIGPLRELIEDMIAHEDRKLRFTVIRSRQGGDGLAAEPTVGLVAARLGIGEKRLYVLRHEQERVSIAFADRILQNAGTGVRLEDLWPHLADITDDEMEMAA